MSSAIQLEIHRPDKEPALYDVDPGVYTIGRDPDCRICLPHPEVESRHAILTLQDNGGWIEDLDAETGTYIGAERIHGRAQVQTDQPVQIGPFRLIIRQPASAAAPAPAAAPEATVLPNITKDIPGEPPANWDPTKKQSIKQQIHQELVKRLDIKRLSASRIDRADLEKKALQTIESIVKDVQDRLPSDIQPQSLIKEVYDEALRLGPLEDFLEDPDITEIMVNGPSQVYVEKKGKLILSDKTFMDNSSVLAIIERIVSPIGRRIDESQPYVDARLPDGSRVNAIIHPISLVGPCLTIRKFSKIPFTDQDLIRFGTMTDPMAEFARICIMLRKNVIVSGGTGSGKTSLLNVLSSYLPSTDRIVTIEDAAELRLTQSHVVRLEARPPNIEGKGAVSIRDLVRNALRMRPDRIVVGECRGGEALDMLQAMNTGHDGSLTTVHANTPRDVISRLETMVLMSGMDLPVRAIREQIASAVDIIFHEARCSDGSRKVTQVTELVGQEGDQITMQDIFEFKQTGVGPQGEVLGAFRPTGAVPTFLEEARTRGLPINPAMFDPQQAQPGPTNRK